MARTSHRPSSPLAAAAFLPAPLTLPLQNGWLHVAREWQPALLDAEGNWQPGWQRQWATIGQHRRAFRTHVEVNGLVFGLAVHPQPLRVAVGSPHMTLERRWLAAALAERSGGGTAVLGWEVLLALWDGADPQAAPLAIELATGLPLAQLPLPPRDWTVVEPVLRARARSIDDHAARTALPLAEQLAQTALSALETAPAARNALLRLVAALPAVEADPTGTTLQTLTRGALHTAAADTALEPTLRAALTSAAAVAEWLPARWLAKLVQRVSEPVARQFLAGVDMHDAAAVLDNLQQQGLDATIDRLGEAVVTDVEADRYLADVLGIVEAVAARHPPGERNAAGQLRAHVSVKCSALCPDYNPDDPAGVWQQAGPRLLALLRLAQAKRVCIQLDAEHRPVRDLTLWLLQQAIAQAPDLHEPALEVGVVVQAYLTDAGAHVQDVLALARQLRTPLAVRLVKGAYWDAETMAAAAHFGLPDHFLHKSETDLHFQHLIVQLLAASADGVPLRLAVASHNLRDHAFACAVQATHYPQTPQLEHQVLHQTATALALGLRADGHAVRVYVPVGSLLMGMAYLVRRILENSSQVGVLTMTRQGAALHSRLLPPAQTLAALQSAHTQHQPVLADGYYTTPPLPLHKPQDKQAFEHAFARLLLPIQLQESDHNGDWLVLTSPCDPALQLGQARVATPGDVDQLVQRAWRAHRLWGEQTPLARAERLWRAAALTRALRLPLAALICAEAGKPRAEALADVDEAADFLHWYADLAAGDETSAQTQPLGVVAVVAPWNFPLAIAVGMAAAALAAGNAVVLKSAEATPLVVGTWLAHCRTMGLFGDELLHVVGPGPTTGAALVAHPLVSGVSFTGSARVGQSLQQLIATTPGPQGLARRLVAELGGKNAVVVCASADLDEAVAILLRSAFGHAGQKCSAASRAVVHQSVFRPLLERLVQAAASLRVGPGWAPGVQLGPVIRQSDQVRLRKAAEACWQEWLADGGDPNAPRCDRSDETKEDRPAGWYVGPVVVPASARQALDPRSTLHQEHFGPILQVVAFATEAEAVSICNAPGYALTAGIVTQDPAEVERLIGLLRAGNVYVNRPITGARVGVEPFGGFGWSGSGPKAGGPLALWPWRHPRLPPEAATWLELPPASTPTQLAWPQPNGPLLADALHSAATQPNAVQAAQAQVLQTLRWLAATLPQQLGSTRTVDRVTLNLPAQRTHLVWLRPRGPVVVVAAALHGGDAGLLYAAGAVLCGCPVVVLAQHAAALQRWQQWLRWWDLPDDDAVRLLGPDDAPEQAAVLDDPQLAVVAVDAAAALPPSWLERTLAPREGVPAARQLLAPNLTTLQRNPAQWLQCFALPTVVAENTLRHGAALQDTASS